MTIYKTLAGVLSILVFTLAPVAQAATHGTLVANDGDDILDTELEALINQHIVGPGYGSMILAFTECYGGDKFDDFAGYPNTALLSGSQAGNTSQYGGYHRGLAQSLVPGTTTNAAHAAASAAALPGDSPTSAGTNENVGGFSSTHVLVWAGDPNAQDQADIDDVHGNFDGQAGTTVTVLSGDGTGANVDGAATRANLEDAIDTIGTQMNTNEQFILFVTDHGNLDDVADNVACVTSCGVTLDCPAYSDMLADPNNQPKVSLFSDAIADPACFDGVLVNGQPLVVPPQMFVLDVNNDGVPDEYKYTMNVAESTLMPAGNNIQINLSVLPSCGGGTALLTHVSLESGGIARTGRAVIPTVSEWGLIVMALLLLTLATVALGRGRHPATA